MGLRATLRFDHFGKRHKSPDPHSTNTPSPHRSPSRNSRNPQPSRARHRPHKAHRNSASFAPSSSASLGRISASVLPAYRVVLHTERAWLQHGVEEVSDPASFEPHSSRPPGAGRMDTISLISSQNASASSPFKSCAAP